MERSSSKQVILPEHLPNEYVPSLCPPSNSIQFQFRFHSIPFIGFAPPAINEPITTDPVVIKKLIQLENGTLLEIDKIYKDNGLSGENSTTIANGCFSTANQQIILVGCLSEYNLFDTVFGGFPGVYCRAFTGMCVNTNNAIVEGKQIYVILL